MRALSRWVGSGALRLTLTALVIAGEYELLAIRFDGGALATSRGPWAVVGNVGVLVSLAVAITTAGVLLTRSWIREELSGVSRSLARYEPRWGLVHVAAYVALSICSSRLFVATGPARTSLGPWFGAWLACAVLTVASLVGFVAPDAWRRLVRIGVRVGAAGFVLGSAAWWVASRAIVLWPHLAGATLRTSASLLRFVGANVETDASRNELGADGFAVTVARECSGVEGMGLILVFVSAYLYRFRQDLRFPRALVLLPVSVAIAFVANAVRVAALVYVGAHVSPSVAFGGFHSKAGWFLFCAIALSVIATVEWSGLFVQESEKAERINSGELTPVYLLPELTVLGVGLFTGLFAAGVDWLYPLRVVCALTVLLILRKYLHGIGAVPSWFSILGGVLVFGAWLLLSPHGDSLAAAELRDGLFALSTATRSAFIVFRVVGSVLVVPLAEELAFRGYLQRRLVAEDFAAVPFRRVTAVSVLVTALSFGALHQAMAAGVVASLVFSGVAYVRGRLSDAVFAHATTNALVAVWVLAAGRWDLWT